MNPDCNHADMRKTETQLGLPLRADHRPKA